MKRRMFMMSWLLLGVGTGAYFSSFYANSVELATIGGTALVLGMVVSLVTASKRI